MNRHSFSFKAIMIAILTVCVTFLFFSVFNWYSKKNIKERTDTPIYFGSTYMTMNNPYFEVLNSEIKSVIEANGDVLLTLDPALSLDKQIEQINYLIDQDVKVIFVNAVELNGLTPSLKKCKKHGIKVVIVDTDVVDDTYVDYTVVSDNYDAGVQAANDMMNRLDHAEIVLLEHSSANSAVQRIKGFTDTIDNDRYKVVYRADSEGQLENATPLINNAIRNGISFNVVMALNDPSALGALASLQENNLLEGVIVYGVDGTPEAKALIRDHKMQASIAQFPIKMGKNAANAAYDLLNNKQINKKAKMPVRIITKDNIDKFNIEGWQ